MANFRNSGVEDRIFRFLGTSPDDAHNRRRLIFFLIVFFVLCIVFKLVEHDENTVQLIKDFTSTIVWLIGIYVGGSVAAEKVPGAPQSSGDLEPKPPSQIPNNPSANSDAGKNPQAG